MNRKRSIEVEEDSADKSSPPEKRQKEADSGISREGEKLEGAEEQPKKERVPPIQGRSQYWKMDMVQVPDIQCKDCKEFDHHDPGRFQYINGRLYKRKSYCPFCVDNRCGMVNTFYRITKHSE
jgi:hypothetical protein